MLKRNNLFSLIKEKKKQFLKNKKLFIMVLIGVSGMLLILLSELFSNDGESVPKNTDSTAEVAGIGSTYKDKMQEDLLKVISKIIKSLSDALKKCWWKKWKKALRKKN